MAKGKLIPKQIICKKTAKSGASYYSVGTFGEPDADGNRGLTWNNSLVGFCSKKNSDNIVIMGE